MSKPTNPPVPLQPPSRPPRGEENAIRMAAFVSFIFFILHSSFYILHFLNSLMEPLKHECGVAMIRLLKPIEYYEQKYGTRLYGLNKLYLMMEKQHNR